MKENVRNIPKNRIPEKWSANKLNEEQMKKVAELGVGDSDKERADLLKGLEDQLDRLPRGSARFKKIPDAAYEEFSIRAENPEARAQIAQILESMGLFPWFDTVDSELDIVVSHPGDIEILGALGLTGVYSHESMERRERNEGEPDALREIRERLQNEKEKLPLQPSQFEQFPTPRSEHQPLVQPMIDTGAKVERAKRATVEAKIKAPEVEEGSDVAEADLELREIADRFDLGLTSEEEGIAIHSFSSMPSLTLFPRKYQWNKEERKLYRIRTGDQVTPGQQHRLYKFSKEDERAMKESVDMNVGLVLWALPAMRKKFPHMDPDDLFQSGLLGLVKALSRYEVAEEEIRRFRLDTKRRNSRIDTDTVRPGWPTYMLKYIEGYMRENARLATPTAVPKSHDQDKRRAYFKGFNAVRHAHPERDVNRAELRETLQRIGVIKSDTDYALDRFETKYWITRFFSSDPDLRDDEAASHVTDMMGEPTIDTSPEKDLSLSERHRLIKEALGALTAREERVLRLRFGLMEGGKRDHENSLEEVGRSMNVSKERIRQMEAKALRKLKHPFHSRKLHSALATE